MIALGARLAIPLPAVRWRRAIPAIIVGVALTLIIYEWSILLGHPERFAHPGTDFAIYRDATARWLAGGPFYLPHQLSGPYVTTVGDVMYPPASLILFAPFTVLPAVLWWAIPLGVTAACLWWRRPSPWAWAAASVCLAWPMAQEMIYTGNPAIWVVAFVSLAIRWPAASALVLLKPSVFPFALIGVWHRSWWLLVASCGLVSLVFGPLWIDWLRVVINARGELSGPLYSLRDAPLLLAPLWVWVDWHHQGRHAHRALPSQSRSHR